MFFLNSYRSHYNFRAETSSSRTWQIFQRFNKDKNLRNNLWFVFLTWSWCFDDHDKIIEHNSFICLYHANVLSLLNWRASWNCIYFISHEIKFFQFFQHLITHFIVASIDSFKFSFFVESIKMFKSFATSSSIFIWKTVIEIFDEFSLFARTSSSFTSIDFFLLSLFKFFESFEDASSAVLSRFFANRFSLIDEITRNWTHVVEWIRQMFIELIHIIVDWCFFDIRVQVSRIARTCFSRRFIAFVCITNFH